MSGDTTADDFENGLAKIRDASKSGKFGKKKLLLFVVVPVVLLLGGGGAAFMMGMFDGSEPAAKASAEESGHGAAHGAAHGESSAAKSSTTSTFYDLPELLVNLNTTGRRPNYLKIVVSLELFKAEDSNRLREVLPRIVDNFQVYLRELRLDDLRGSAGMYRLREELLARVNAAAQPVKVKEVLFKEMLVQ